MILILTATDAVFSAGLVADLFAMVVIGIHAKQHHSSRMGAHPKTLIGDASPDGGPDETRLERHQF